MGTPARLKGREGKPSPGLTKPHLLLLSPTIINSLASPILYNSLERHQSDQISRKASISADTTRTFFGVSANTLPLPFSTSRSPGNQNHTIQKLQYQQQFLEFLECAASSADIQQLQGSILSFPIRNKLLETCKVYLKSPKVQKQKK